MLNTIMQFLQCVWINYLCFTILLKLWFTQWMIYVHFYLGRAETFITLAKVTLINMFSSCFWSSLSFIFFKSIKENQSLGLFETFKKSISALRFLKHFLKVIRYLCELMKSAVLIQRKKWDINWTQDTSV